MASCDRPGDPAGMLCRFDGASNTRTLSITIEQAMRQYLKAHPAIRPATEGRIVAEDASGRTCSQRELARAVAARKELK